MLFPMEDVQDRVAIDFSKFSGVQKGLTVGSVTECSWTLLYRCEISVTAARSAREHAGELCLAGARSNVERVFELSGLNNYAHVYHDVESAVAHLGV